MPQGSDFLFALQSKDYQFWQVDSTGNVFLSAKPYFLDFAPSGWDSIEIANIRNKKYWGIDRSVTLPLSYVNDGATILKYIFYTLGIEESCYLVIANQQLDYDTVPQGTISISTGGNLLAGHNTGNISAAPGSTVYVKLTGGAYSTGYIGTVLVSAGGQVYPVTIPVSGSVAYDILATAGGNTMEIVNKSGGVTASYGYWYKQIYRAEVDLSTFSHIGSKVTATTLEDGLAKFLKANESTTYEFPMDVPEAVTIKMDGVDFVDKLNYEQIDGVDVSYATDGDRFYSPSSFISNDGDSVDVLTNSENLEGISGTATWADILASDNYLLENIGDHVLPVTITGHLEFRCTKMVSSPAFAVRFRFLRSEQLLANQNDYQIFASPAMVVGQKYSIDYSLTIPLNPHEKLFLEGIYFGGVGSDAIIQFTDQSKFSISLVTKHGITYIKCFPPQYLFGLLVTAFTEGNYTASISDYFTKNLNIVFTSGNAIRGLTDENNIYSATIKISFTDFFKFWNSYDAVGIIENQKTIGFDKEENLIDSVNIIDLPEVGADSLKISVAKEYLFNELQVGYPPIKNDVGVLNGNEEFNTKFIFSLGTTKAPAVLDKVSTVKASCYEIEKIRVTTLDKTTTDYKADNDLFVLQIENILNPAVGIIPESYNLDRSLNASATGLIEPLTVFNIGLSPKRMLLNNGSFMRSAMYLCDTKILKFISADKNNKLAAGGVVENADVSMGSLNGRFFLPIYFDFEIEAPDGLLDLLDINPLSLFRFPFKGNTYTGILNKVSVAPSNRKAQAWQLLSTATNDLTNLILFYGG